MRLQGAQLACGRGGAPARSRISDLRSTFAPANASRTTPASGTLPILTASVPGCGWPQRDCQCSSRRAASDPIPARIVAKLRTEKKGRGGKTVTVVYGLPKNDEFLKKLSQELKRACGTGGTVVDGGVELQGDLRDRVRAALVAQGYVVFQIWFPAVAAA
jgi:translation initiation factor 1